jgi:hypothetical protein
MLLDEISLLIITIRRNTYIHSLGKIVKCLNVTHRRTGTCSHQWDLNSKADKLSGTVYVAIRQCITYKALDILSITY